MNTPDLPADLRPLLESGLVRLGLEPALATPLLAYLALLVRWNKTYNLTAVRDPHEMVTKHLLDSLAMHPYVEAIAARGGALADLGTGAGLPGIPLAIVRPGLRVTLVESNGKKARFMREAVRQLGLTNARVAESRAEALDEAGRYDQLTARAMDTLAGIVRVGGHLLRPGGVLADVALAASAAAGALAAPGWPSWPACANRTMQFAPCMWPCQRKPPW